MKEKLALVICEKGFKYDKNMFGINYQDSNYEIVDILTEEKGLAGKKIAGHKVKQINDSINADDYDDIVIIGYKRREGFETVKKTVLETLAIEEKKIAPHTALFFLPKDPNTGTFMIDDSVERGKWCDLNYLINNDLIKASNDLETFFLGSKHKNMYKWLHYFEVYDKVLNRYRNRNVTILEIGVSNGGSMEMWKSYFGEKAVIVGIDINPKCKSFETDSIKIEIGSQEDEKFLGGVAKKYGHFDIIIDDGGHTMKQQILSFRMLFPVLSSGGTYICEDCHTSYWTGYGGGYNRKGTFIEFAKRCVDGLNVQFIGKKDRLAKKAAALLPTCLAKFPGIGRICNIYNLKYNASYPEDQIDSISFYDSMVVFEKRHKGYSFQLSR